MVSKRFYCKTSFARTVNFTVFLSDPFDLFDGHFDGQSGCVINFACQSVRHH